MRTPVLFVSHGSPMLALEPEHPWAQSLRGFVQGLVEPPKALLVVSAHWQTQLPQVTGAVWPGVMHDFSGFPAPLYALDYPAPGQPELSNRISGLLGASVDPLRRLDHGAWAVLRHAWPQAEVPVVQLSLPRWTPADLHQLGTDLALLRNEGVLIIGSGGLVHNLQRADFKAEDGAVDTWALEAEAWFLERLDQGSNEDLFAHREGAILSREAAPTTEHLDPLFVALGAAGNDPFRTLFEGWQLGNLSLRTLAWEAL